MYRSLRMLRGWRDFIAIVRMLSVSGTMMGSPKFLGALYDSKGIPTCAIQVAILRNGNMRQRDERNGQDGRITYSRKPVRLMNSRV